MSPINQISVIPETHVIRVENQRKVSNLSFRVDGKGREFVSFADDESNLEWKLSKSHESLPSLMNHISSWVRDHAINVSILVPTGNAGDPVFSKQQAEILELLCLQYLAEREACVIAASSWQITNDSIDDLLASGIESSPDSSNRDVEIVPETTSVRIESVAHFHKFVRRLLQCAYADTTLFVRFVLFKQGIILHVIFGSLESSISSMSVVPAARSAKKSGNPFYGKFSTTQRCLLPLLAGNSKPFLVIQPGRHVNKSAVLFQSLLDLCERTCLTALPCHQEESCMRVEEFEIVGSVDLLPLRIKNETETRKLASIPSLEKSVEILPQEEELKEGVAQLDAELEEVRRSSIMANDSYNTSESELHDEKSRNLLLRAEIDKLKVSGGGAGNVNAYTNHLLSEVKQLRAELAAVESERRKYLTSKRLVESLIEKSNKSKAETLAKQAKLEEMKKSEENLRKEMSEMKRNCEDLISTNRTLERELEKLRLSPPIDPPPTVESVYHQFLFPFQSKREMEKSFITLHDSLAKIERAVAVNCPAVVLDVKRSSDSMHRLKDSVNELLSASEKLEISAVTLLKSSAAGKTPSRRINK